MLCVRETVPCSPFSIGATPAGVILRSNWPRSFLARCRSCYRGTNRKRAWTTPRRLVFCGTNSAQLWNSSIEQERLSERAHEDREIVYSLQQPETHAFRLYHDYPESRPGADKYFNVVRTGSKVSDPSAYVLDTGEKLSTRTMTGAELASAKIDAGEPVDAAAS